MASAVLALPFWKILFPHHLQHGVTFLCINSIPTEGSTIKHHIIDRHLPWAYLIANPNPHPQSPPSCRMQKRGTTEKAYCRKMHELDLDLEIWRPGDLNLNSSLDIDRKFALPGPPLLFSDFEIANSKVGTSDMDL